MENRQDLYELVELCRKNDRTAQRIIFDRFKRAMFAICKRYAKSIPEAEDNLIEGFTKVFTNIETYDGYGSFESWVKKIIINTCTTTYNRELKHNTVERLDELREEKVNVEAATAYSKEDLYAALNALSFRQRFVFNMIVIDGYSYAEVASLLGVSVDVVRTVLHRTKLNLRKCLLK